MRATTSTAQHIRYVLPILALMFTPPSLGIGQDVVKPDPKYESEQKIAALLRKFTDSTKSLSLSDQEQIIEIYFKTKSERRGLVLEAMQRHSGSFESLQSKLKHFENHYDRVRSHQRLFSRLRDATIFTQEATDLFPSDNKISELKRKAVKKLTNPYFDALDNMTNYALDSGVSKLMKPDQTEFALRKFAGLALDKSVDPKIQEMRLKDAAEYLNARVLNNPSFKEMSATDQVGMVKALQTKIKDVVEQHQDQIVNIGRRVDATEADLSRTIKTVDWVVSKVDEVAQTNARLGKEINELGKSTQESIQSLNSKVEGNLKKIKLLQNDHAQLRETTHENTFAIGILKRHMYDDLPTNEKLAWIKSEFYPLPQGEMDKEILRLTEVKLTEDRLAVANKVGSYLDNCGKILAVADNLGLDPDFVKTGQEVVEKASQSVDVVKAAISGDPIGAIAGIGNMIFGGGPDIATVRHQQIMAEFKQVKAELKQIQQTQQIILNNLVVISEKLDALARLAVDNHIEVMERLDEVDAHVLWNQKMLLELLSKDLSTCRDFLRIEEKSQYSDRVAFAQLHPDWYNTSITGLFQHLGLKSGEVGDRNVEFSSVFFLESYQKEMDHKSKLTDRKELLRSFASSLPRDVNDATKRAITSLLSPSLTTSELVDKVANVRTIEPSSRLEYRQFGDAINITAVLNFGDLVLRMVPFAVVFNEADKNRSLYPPDEFITGEAFQNTSTKNAESIELLSRTLRLVDLATAQESLFQGDWVAANFARTLREPATIERCKVNPLVGQNVVRTWLQIRAKESGGTPLGYKVALESSDAAYLQFFTNHKGRFEKRDHEGGKRWFIYLDERDDNSAFLLPTMDEFENGRLLLSGACQRLLILQNRLRDALANYEFKQGLSDDDNLAISRILAESVASPN